MPPQIGETRSFPLGPAPRQQDLDVRQALLLLRQLRAQAEQDEEELLQQRMRTRLLDPLEAAKTQETVRQFRERRDVQEMLPPPTAAQRVAGLRQGVLPPSLRGRVRMPPAPGPPTLQEGPEEAVRILRGTRRISEGPQPARRIRRFGTAPTLTEARAGAEAFRDPNFPAAYAREEATARLHPSVLAAEAYARRPVAGQQDDEGAFLDAALPQLFTLARTLNRVGGPAGVAIGGVRRNVTGPTGINENARLFNSIFEPTALNLASEFNGGRPTEPDKEAAGLILPQMGDSPDIVEAKIRIIEEARRNPGLRVVRDPATGRQLQIRSGLGAEGGGGRPARGRFSIEPTGR